MIEENERWSDPGFDHNLVYEIQTVAYTSYIQRRIQL